MSEVEKFSISCLEMLNCDLPKTSPFFFLLLKEKSLSLKEKSSDLLGDMIVLHSSWPNRDGWCGLQEKRVPCRWEDEHQAREKGAHMDKHKTSAWTQTSGPHLTGTVAMAQCLAQRRVA